MLSDPYAILELKENASDAEVKAAYRRLATLYHPDRNPGFQQAATERLKQLNEAHALILAARQTRPDGDASNTRRAHGKPRGGYRNSGQGRRDDVREPAGRPAKEDSEAHVRARHAAIEATLARLKFPSSLAIDRILVIEVLGALMPRGPEIVACMPYSELRCNRISDFEAVSDRFLRFTPPALGPATWGGPMGGAARLPSIQLVVCTKNALLWTMSYTAHADGLVVEECVSLYRVPFVSVRGAIVRKNGIVKVSVAERPTLTFRMATDAAAEMSARVDSASAMA